MPFLQTTTPAVVFRTQVDVGEVQQYVSAIFLSVENVLLPHSHLVGPSSSKFSTHSFPHISSMGKNNAMVIRMKSFYIAIYKLY